MRHSVFGLALLGLVAIAAAAEAAHQKAAVLATIPTPSRPHIVAVDPITNRVYVSLLFSAGVKVIDGATNTVIDDYPVAAGPSAVAVNPITRRLYVTHGRTLQAGGNTVSVLDADTGELLASIPVGGGPEFVKVNTLTNKIYVAQTQQGSDIVVIDGATNGVVGVIPVGGGSHGIDIDEASNTIYATVRIPGNLVVIDGASDTVTSTITLGGHPWAVTVNPVLQRIYVTKDSLFVPGNTVTILDSLTLDVLSTVPVGNRPLGITANPLTDRVYVSHVGSNAVYVLDGETGAVTQIVFSTGSGPFGIGINLVTDRVYVANAFSYTVSVIGDDLDPPAWPAGSQLSVYQTNFTSVILQWTPATDNSRVVRYLVYRDSVLAATVSGFNTFATIDNLAAGTSYAFKVEACDIVDNCSTDGPGVIASTLTVVGAIDRLGAIIDALVASGALGAGQATGLLATLQQAVAHYEAGRFAQAVNLLDAFINQVEAFRMAGVLSPVDAYRLIFEATAIREVIGAMP